MKREEVIPLTQNWLGNANLYFILEIFYTNLQWIDYDTAREPFLLFKLNKPLLRGVINRTTWYDKGKLLETLEMPRQEDFLCLIPKQVLTLLFAAIRPLGAKERNTICRVFFYIYYNAMRTTNGWYSHSRDAVVKELEINAARFSSTIKWLEQHGFLARSNYLVGIEARTYYIPEFLWTEECERFNSRKKLN